MDDGFCQSALQTATAEATLYYYVKRQNIENTWNFWRCLPWLIYRNSRLINKNWILFSKADSIGYKSLGEITHRLRFGDFQYWNFGRHLGLVNFVDLSPSGCSGYAPSVVIHELIDCAVICEYWQRARDCKTKRPT